MKLQLTLFINMSVAYDDGMTGIVWFSYALEILIYLMTFVTVPICHYITSTAHVYHTNSLLILHTGVYHFCLYGIARAFMIFCYEAQLGLTCEIYAETSETCPLGLQIVSFTRAYVIILFQVGFMGIMVERIVALNFYATYEERYYRPYFYALTIFGVLLAVGITACFFFAVPFFTRNISNAVEIVTTLLAGLVTLMIAKINDDLQQKLHEKDYTLSARYQLTLNVKAIRIMQIYIVYTILNNIVYSILFGIHQASISWSARNVLGMLINLQLAVQYFTFSWMGTCCNRQSYELSKRILQAKLKEIRFFRKQIDDGDAAGKAEEKLVINTSGKIMYMDAKQDDYFAQLNAQWG